MCTATLTEPANTTSSTTPIDTMPVPAVDPEHRSTDGDCRVCGSSATAQMQDGTWVCTQCHSTWRE